MKPNRFLTFALGECILCGGLALVALPSEAAQLDFDRIYVFGDSLSDPGNLFNLLGQQFPPSPPYSDGRVSNGPVWAEYLAQDLGLSPASFGALTVSPNLALQGINLAFAGANTDATNVNNTNGLLPPTTPPLPGLTQQLATYQTFQTQLGAIAAEKALYVLWVGANDYLGGGALDPTQPLSKIDGAIDTLYGLGARNFLIGNLPDLGLTPQAIALGLQTPLNQITQAHNQGLANILTTKASQYQGTHFTSLDVNTLFSNITQSPATFGFSQTQTSCIFISPGNIQVDPDLNGCGQTSLFWDNLHPTTKGHRLIADLALASLQPAPVAIPEPTPLTLIGLGIVAGGFVARRRTA